MATLNYLQALSRALTDEMARDERVVILGEQVDDAVFPVTAGLRERFGDDRCIALGAAEGMAVGTAVGMAIGGLRPVSEIQFADFVYPAFEQIVSEAAAVRYRSGGEWTCPMVVRMPCGGGVAGGPFHSQSPEALFCHTPGLKVVMPSNPLDASRLLRAAIRDDDPVLFFEPKVLYRASRCEVPDDDGPAEIGTARTVVEGDDVTVVAYGAMVDVCTRAAAEAAENAISVEVIDLRTLVPIDEEAILASVRRTGRLVLAHEAPRTGGFAAELAATVVEKAVDSLEAPIVRVTGLDAPYPHSLEHIYRPDEHRVLAAIEQVIDF